MPTLPGAREWEWLLHQPAGLHIALILLTVGTADHLLLDHGIVAVEDKAVNLRAHLEVHRGHR